MTDLPASEGGPPPRNPELDAAITELAESLLRLVEVLAEAPGDAAPAAQIPAELPFTSISQADHVKAWRLWRDFGRGLITELPERGCPVCGDSEARALFVSHDGFPYSSCDDCGCWFLSKLVDGAVFERFFEICPDARAVAEGTTKARARDPGLEGDVGRIGPYLDALKELHGGSPDLRYLDVGCGVGNSLVAAEGRGLEGWGVDADRAAVAVARGLGRRVLHTDDDLPPGPFDLVSFWETLEHMTDPRGALGRYLPLLSEWGLLGITVPNLNAPSVRLQRGDSSVVGGGVVSPGHLNLLDAEALRRLLDREGLEIVEVDAQYSSNPTELLAYLVGASRGTRDLVEEADAARSATATLVDLANGLGPALELAERLALTAPILGVVACRRGARGRFERAARERRQRRLETIADLARGRRPASAGVSRSSELVRLVSRLQAEVDRRDVLLRDVHSAATAGSTEAAREVAKRDDMLAALQQQLHSEAARMTSEVERRDRMLADLHDELTRTQYERNDLAAKVRELTRRLEATSEPEKG